MADDFEDLYDIDAMDDQEIEDLIVQQIREYPDLDADLIDVRVERGFVTLAGRVGTEQEMQEVGQIVSDVLGIRDYSNEIVIDELRRAEYSDAADEANAQDAEVESQLGEGNEATTDTAAHLMQDVEAEMHGTHDPSQAVEGAIPYRPADRPIQEGSWSEENH